MQFIFHEHLCAKFLIQQTCYHFIPLNCCSRCTVLPFTWWSKLYHLQHAFITFISYSTLNAIFSIDFWIKWTHTQKLDQEKKLFVENKIKFLLANHEYCHVWMVERRKESAHFNMTKAHWSRKTSLLAFMKWGSEKKWLETVKKWNKWWKMKREWEREWEWEWKVFSNYRISFRGKSAPIHLQCSSLYTNRKSQIACYFMAIERINLLCGNANTYDIFNQNFSLITDFYMNLRKVFLPAAFVLDTARTSAAIF